jgi:asparagine synthase (glutamine-hydrolysing)
MPGHWLQLDLKRGAPRPEIAQYWDVPRPGSTEARSDSDWIRDCRKRLEEAVETRLMSDVPLGMFLSGGVDSSAIAALIKRKTSSAVKTFSVGYREAQFSELSYAAEVARTIGTDHHETVVGMQDFFQALPDLVWHEDEPIAWPSSVSLYFVSKLAAQEVKVVLTGEGADELFAGYKRYAHQLVNEKAMRYYSGIPLAVRRWVRGQIAGSGLLSASMRVWSQFIWTIFTAPFQRNSRRICLDRSRLEFTAIICGTGLPGRRRRASRECSTRIKRRTWLNF